MLSNKMQAALVAFCVCALSRQVLSVGAARPCYPAIFVFGDSLSDTGNGNLTGSVFFGRTAHRPYGSTFPGYPSSRFSDGRLLVDFLASFIGLPLVKPSLDHLEDFSTGANYAVSGATAQDAKFLRNNFILPLTNLSLDVQIGWHLQFQASTTRPNKPSAHAFSNGLYVIEIGGNDYIGALQSLYTTSYISSTIVPLVIAKIKNATEVLYANGARAFLFIGITPLGCSPSLLSTFLQQTKDNIGCLQEINSLSQNHGARLKNMVENLSVAHPDATFIFVDYYGAYMQVIQNYATYGFSNTLDACCGSGPIYPYRYNLLLFCNSLSSTSFSTLCSNPNVYLNWDGIHFTDKFNSMIFNLTISTGSYLHPSNSFSSCTIATH